MIPFVLIPAGIAAVSGDDWVAEGAIGSGLLLAVALVLAEMRCEIFGGSVGLLMQTSLPAGLQQTRPRRTC